MNYEIELKFDSLTHGGFYIFEEGNRLAELEFTLNSHTLRVYHTGVRKHLEGQGIAGKLFDALVDYARENHYKIIPVCPYILRKFNKNPELYDDLRAKDGE